ncbi:pentapeptide repeat-containing protein [Microbacteriaceae bacterium VKM Ac-2855]|nr:pentapeptide repeat-containing protein [Microbacteriaceae bacterium VKM Ac-2855]
MASRSSTLAPRIDPLRLHDLAPGYAGDLGARESVEGLDFDGLDVSGAVLTGLAVSECRFTEASFSDTDLRASSFVETLFSRLDAPILRAPRSRLKDVVVEHSRIGSGELYESTIESVRFRDCKLGYVNLRGAKLQDVLFERCTIDELDLGGATGTRVAIVDSEVRSIDFAGGRFTNVDLRAAELRTLAGLEGMAGVTLSEFQVSLMAGLFAAHFGIRVE